MELRAGRVLRIGHKGAAALAPEKHAALAPENTLRSLALAVELGCDLVEFDVLSLDDGTLVLAHSDDLREVSHGSSHGRVRPLALAALRAAAPELATLHEALAFLGDCAPRTGLHVDLKAPGYEQEVIDALRRHGAVERAVVSTFHASSLRAVGMIEPRLARGLTYPHGRYRARSCRRLGRRPLSRSRLAGGRGPRPRPRCRRLGLDGRRRGHARPGGCSRSRRRHHK